MKTLTNRKKTSCFNRFVLFVVAISLISTFTACSNDDDGDNIPIYSTKDVEGNYTGLMLTESEPVVNPHQNAGKEGEAPEGIEVKAEVKDNQIKIDKLPVDELIKSIITDEGQAEIIIKGIGDVSYAIPYTPTFDESKNHILLQLKPEPLVIKFAAPVPEPHADEEETNEISIKVTIETNENGNFTYDGSILKFAIKATKVEVGELPFEEFPATTFSFNMTKK